MPARRTFMLRDEATTALENYVIENYRGKKKHGAYSRVMSDAIVWYVRNESMAPVKDMLRDQVVPIVRGELARLASLIVKVGIDVDMILLDMLDVRSQENPDVPLDVLYEQLREASVEEFRKQRNKEIVDKYSY